jgi:hypothetical protein
VKDENIINIAITRQPSVTALISFEITEQRERRNCLTIFKDMLFESNIQLQQYGT